MIPTIIVVAVVLVIALAIVVAVYNGLVGLKNRFQNAYAQIDVQLKRRYDLIPNLVETAKGYLAHERETLENVVRARAAAISGLQAAKANPGDPASIQALGGAEAALSGALGRLLAVAEAYPDLKANQTMMQLSEELTATENKLAFTRQAYNDSVLGYNNACEVFPNNLMAGLFGFRPAEMLQVAEPADREAPKVSFAK